MKWAEESPGCWVSEAGVIVTTDGKLECRVNEMGPIQLPRGATLAEAQTTVETAYAVRRRQGAPADTAAMSASARRGRKPKGERPMSAAERQATRMRRLQQKAAGAVTTLQQLGQAPLDPTTKEGLAEVWDRRRIEIRQWLETEAHPLAAVYVAIVTFIHMPELPARLHFVAHGIRELGNRLPGYLDEVSSDQVRYPELVRPIFDLWEQTGLPVGGNAFPLLIEGTTPPGEADVGIPMDLAKRIALMLGRHEEGAMRTKKKSAVLFEALKRDAGSATGGAQFAVRRWDEIRDWAANNVHVGPTCSNEEIRDRFAEFERILYALVGRFVHILGEVDQVLSAAPSSETIDSAIALLSRGGARNYFFDRVDNPVWLTALDERHYFDALLDGEHWPESAFLKRMASQQPERVTQILSRLTKAPDTVVAFYLIDIALALPPPYAAQLAKTIAKIANEARPPLTFWHDLPRLIVHLAGGAQGRAAFMLFDAMYSPRRKTTLHGSEEMSFPNSSNDLWHLQEGLQSILPALLAVDAKKVIQALCSKLKAVLKGEGLLGPGLDHSYIIYTRVTMTDANHFASDIVYDAGTLFVRAILTAARSAIQSCSVDVDEMFEIIEGKEAIIFTCVSMTLLASIGSQANERAVTVIAKPQEYADSVVEDSYGRLIQARFAEVPMTQRNAVLGWLRKGPDIEAFVVWWEKRHGVKPTAEEWEAYRKYWIRKRLGWVPRNLLPAADADLLMQIEGEMAPEPTQWSVIGVHPSPKSLEELQAMSPEDIAEFLGLNPPNAERKSDSELDSLLTQVVQGRIGEFSRAARSYIGINQSRVRSVLWGLGNPAKQGEEIDWAPVLDLCAWVVAQPRNGESRDPTGRGDVSWRGARAAVADLIRGGLQNAKAPISHGFAPEIWAVLEQLSEDPDPTTEFEQERAFEPAMLSINTVRGKAMLAVVQYALWRRRQMNEDGLAGGFDTIPEVRALLDRRLDRDLSPAVRSVYAQYFPALVYLDAEWATAVAPIIFPAAVDEIRFWRASWSVYATFSQTYDRVFEILRPTYELAVRRMPWDEGSETTRDATGEDWRQAEENVACHLLAFYWRGKIELDRDSLLVRYFGRCGRRARSRALWFAANSLASHKGDVPAGIQRRMIDLWEWRMKEADVSNDPKDREEMQTFGGWFAHGKLDPNWSVQMLIKVLKLTNNIDRPGLVIGRLAAIALTDLRSSVDCLDAFVDADREGWRYITSKDQVEAILRAGLASDQPDVASTARRIVDKLTERGSLEYRRLLDDPSGGAA